MRKVKKTFIFLIIPFLIWGIERFCHQKTDGFTLWRVSSDLSFHKEWETAPLDPEEKEKITGILKQPFTYYGKGAQTFVFLSEDQQTILKLFRYYRMRPPIWASLLPSFFSERKRLRRNALLQQDFESYALAFDQLREETGLLFVHLNKTEDLKQKLTLTDKIGIRHEIDLDQMEFLIQKKASLVPSSLEHWMKNNDLPSAIQAINALLELLVARSKKGIFDKDPDFLTNFGFCNGKAIQIDVGRFRKDPSRKEKFIYRDDVIRAADPFKKWLEHRYPHLAEYVDKKIETL